MVAGREGSRRASVKRPDRSEIQPFAANWAGQITSPLMTSASASPAWNSMRSFSKYWLVSAGARRSVNSLARLRRPSSPEGEEEGGALADVALGPHHAPVTLHDALDRREPYAGALEVLRRVQALERAEELGRVGHVEPDPVVADVVDRAPVRDAELHDGAPLLLGELERVAQQVLERDPQQAGVAGSREALRDHELHLPIGSRPPELGGDLAGDRAQVHAAARERAARHPREVEQVVYEGGHAPAGGPHPAEVAAGLLVEPPGVVLQEYLGEALDAPQGSPKVVGDRVGEGLELLVGRLQLPVGLLEVAVGVLQLPVGGLELRADALGLEAAVREHPGDAEEHQAYRQPAQQHEEREAGSPAGLEAGERAEVEAPDPAGDLHGRDL